MEKETSLKVLNSLKVDNDSTASGNPEDHNDSDNIDTDPGETIENDQVEEKEDEEYLSRELDGKSLPEKISHLWTEWTRKDIPLFDITSKGSFAIKFVLWCLRYAFV